MNGHVRVVGATGVVGGAVARHLATQPEGDLTVASRRDLGIVGVAHVGVDLLDRAASITALSAPGDVTHVVYAASVDRGSMTEALGPDNTMLAHTLAGLENAGVNLERVVLIGGGESYGEHLGPDESPARESDPRHLRPILYHDQEDLLRQLPPAS